MATMRKREIGRQQRVSLGMLLLNPIDGDRKFQLQPSRRRRGENRKTLKDLLLSTNPFDRIEEDHQDLLIPEEQEIDGGMSSAMGRDDGGEFGCRRFRPAGPAGCTGIRLRLSKRAWRPMLIAIPE